MRCPAPFWPDAVFFSRQQRWQARCRPTQDSALLRLSGYVLSHLGNLFQYLPACLCSAEISFRSIGIRSLLTLRHILLFSAFRSIPPGVPAALISTSMGLLSFRGCSVFDFAMHSRSFSAHWQTTNQPFVVRYSRTWPCLLRLVPFRLNVLAGALGLAVFVLVVYIICIRTCFVHAHF